MLSLFAELCIADDIWICLSLGDWWMSAFPGGHGGGGITREIIAATLARENSACSICMHDVFRCFPNYRKIQLLLFLQ